MPVIGGGAGGGTLTDKGLYTPGTTYQPGDVITFAAGRYACNAAHTATQIFNATKWTKLDATGLAPYTAQRGWLVDDFSDVSAWITASGTAPTLTQGTGDATFPSCLHVVATANCQIVRPCYADLSGGRFVSFSYRVTAGTMTSIGVELVVGGTTYGNRFEQAVGFSEFPSVWTTVAVPMAALTASGTATTAKLTDVRQLGVYLSGSGAFTADIADIRIHDNPLPAGVIFTFDDARQSQYDNALGILQTAGYVGTVYCAPTILGTSPGGGSGPLMSLANLQAMKAAGWSVGCHGYTHTDLTTLTSAQRKTEFDNAYDYLISNGLASPGGMHLAYPYGAHNEATVADARAYFRSSRTTADRQPEDALAPFVGQRHRLKTMYWNSGGSMFSVANAQAAIDRIVDRGGIAAFTFHEVGTAYASDTALTISNADLTTIANYAASKHLPCYTMDDLFPAQTPGAVTAAAS